MAKSARKTGGKARRLKDLPASGTAKRKKASKLRGGADAGANAMEAVYLFTRESLQDANADKKYYLGSLSTARRT
jgi:hypothetical protein